MGDFDKIEFDFQEDGRKEKEIELKKELTKDDAAYQEEINSELIVNNQSIHLNLDVMKGRYANDETVIADADNLNHLDDRAMMIKYQLGHPIRKPSFPDGDENIRSSRQPREEYQDFSEHDTSANFGPAIPQTQNIEIKKTNRMHQYSRQ